MPEKNDNTEIYRNPAMTPAHQKAASLALRADAAHADSTREILDQLTAEWWAEDKKGILSRFWERNRSFERDCNHFLDRMTDDALNGRGEIRQEPIERLIRESGREDHLLYLAIAREHVRCGMMDPEQAILRQMEKRAGVLYTQLAKLNTGADLPEKFAALLQAMKKVQGFTAETAGRFTEELRALHEAADDFVKAADAQKNGSAVGRARIQMARLISSFAENAVLASEIHLDPTLPIEARHLPAEQFGNFFPEADSEILKQVREERQFAFRRWGGYARRSELSKEERRQFLAFDFSFHEDYAEEEDDPLWRYERRPEWRELFDRLAQNFLRDEMQAALKADSHAAEKMTAAQIAGRYEAIRYGWPRTRFVKILYDRVPESGQFVIPTFEEFKALWAQSVNDTAAIEKSRPYRNIFRRGEREREIDPVMDDTNAVTDPAARAASILNSRIRMTVDRNIEHRLALKQMDEDEIDPELDGPNAYKLRQEPIDREALMKRSSEWVNRAGGLKELLTAALSRLPGDRLLTMRERNLLVDDLIDLTKLIYVKDRLNVLRASGEPSKELEDCEKTIRDIGRAWKDRNSSEIDLAAGPEGLQHRFSIPDTKIPGVKEFLEEQMEMNLLAARSEKDRVQDLVQAVFDPEKNEGFDFLSRAAAPVFREKIREMFAPSRKSGELAHNPETAVLAEYLESMDRLWKGPDDGKAVPSSSQLEKLQRLNQLAERTLREAASGMTSISGAQRERLRDMCTRLGLDAQILSRMQSRLQNNRQKICMTQLVLDAYADYGAELRKQGIIGDPGKRISRAEEDFREAALRNLRKQMNSQGEKIWRQVNSFYAEIEVLGKESVFYNTKDFRNLRDELRELGKKRPESCQEYLDVLKRMSDQAAAYRDAKDADGKKQRGTEAGRRRYDLAVRILDFAEQARIEMKDNRAEFQRIATETDPEFMRKEMAGGELGPVNANNDRAFRNHRDAEAQRGELARELQAHTLEDMDDFRRKFARFRMLDFMISRDWNEVLENMTVDARNLREQTIADSPAMRLMAEVLRRMKEGEKQPGGPELPADAQRRRKDQAGPRGAAALPTDVRDLKKCHAACIDLAKKMSALRNMDEASLVRYREDAAANQGAMQRNSGSREFDRVLGECIQEQITARLEEKQKARTDEALKKSAIRELRAKDGTQTLLRNLGADPSAPKAGQKVRESENAPINPSQHIRI